MILPEVLYAPSQPYTRRNSHRGHLSGRNWTEDAAIHQAHPAPRACSQTQATLKPSQHLFRIEQIQFFFSGTITHVDLQQRDNLSLNVACPTCGAPAGERCDLDSGQVPNVPHRDRRLKAADKKTA
jgi:hypothetical protein